MMMHDTNNLAHDIGRMQSLAQEGAAHGVITAIVHFRPHHWPAFLRNPYSGIKPFVRRAKLWVRRIGSRLFQHSNDRVS
jgi:hypothetical protein